MEDYLVMKDVTKIYNNGIIANDKVNFSAKKGEIHAICGENGAGKTTLMKMLFGIEQPDHGEIIIINLGDIFHNKIILHIAPPLLKKENL